MPVCGSSYCCRPQPPEDGKVDDLRTRLLAATTIEGDGLAQQLRGTGPWRWGRITRMFLFSRGLVRYITASKVVFEQHCPWMLSSCDTTSELTTCIRACNARQVYVPADMPTRMGSIGSWVVSGEAQVKLRLCATDYVLHFTDVNAPWKFSALKDGERVGKGEVRHTRAKRCPGHARAI